LGSQYDAGLAIYKPQFARRIIEEKDWDLNFDGFQLSFHAILNVRNA